MRGSLLSAARVVVVVVVVLASASSCRWRFFLLRPHDNARRHFFMARRSGRKGEVGGKGERVWVGEGEMPSPVEVEGGFESVILRGGGN